MSPSCLKRSRIRPAVEHPSKESGRRGRFAAGCDRCASGSRVAVPRSWDWRGRRHRCRNWHRTRDGVVARSRKRWRNWRRCLSSRQRCDVAETAS
jgi:hypothetical protein